MAGLIVILFFALLVAVPMFYIVGRKLFPRASKRLLLWAVLILAVLTVTGLAVLLTGSAGA